MIFLLQFVETVEAVVDGIELCRVEINPFQTVADLFSDILQFDISAVHALGQFRGVWKDAFDTSHGRDGCT